jgi:hypothetical protein
VTCAPAPDPRGPRTPTSPRSLARCRYAGPNTPASLSPRCLLASRRACRQMRTSNPGTPAPRSTVGNGYQRVPTGRALSRCLNAMRDARRRARGGRLGGDGGCASGCPHGLRKGRGGRRCDVPLLLRCSAVGPLVAPSFTPLGQPGPPTLAHRADTSVLPTEVDPPTAPMASRHGDPAPSTGMPSAVGGPPTLTSLTARIRHHYPLR